MRRQLVALCGLALVSAGCGSEGASDQSGLPVSVTRGAPSGMQGAGGRVAQYVPTSHSVVYVSGFQYSSSCVPSGTASQTGGVVTLKIDSPDGNCTDDAERDTFQVDHVTGPPKRLRVIEQGEPDIELRLTS